MANMPREQIKILLRYEGPDVDDGTMGIQDIVPVLQGFASAYGKLAITDDPSSTHRLRITGITQGTATIWLDVWTFLDHNANVIQSGAVVGSAATYIVSKIAGVIRAKKHVKRQPFTDRIGQSNNIIVTNSENVTIEMPFEIYELFKSGTLDADLAKITSPLVQGKIDAAELEARSVDATVLRERIEASERPYFDTTVTTVTSTQPIWIVAKLNSLTKSTNSGYLWLTDGTRVFYRYTGDSAAKLYSLFPYDIPVRVFCVAHQDANFKTASVDILDIERAQGELFPHSIEEPESPEEDSTP